MLSVLLAILIFSVLLGIPALASEEHDDQKKVDTQKQFNDLLEETFRKKKSVVELSLIHI